MLCIELLLTLLNQVLCHKDLSFSVLVHHIKVSDGHRFILTTSWPPLLKLSYLSIFDTVDIFYLAQVMELLQILKTLERR